MRAFPLSARGLERPYWLRGFGSFASWDSEELEVEGLGCDLRQARGRGVDAVKDLLQLTNN